MGLLDLLGYQKGEQQGETARQAIRWMTGAAPAFFLVIGVLLRARLSADARTPPGDPAGVGVAGSDPAGPWNFVEDGC